MGPVVVDPNVKPGEYVAQTLFLEFIAMAEKKIAAVAQEPIEKALTKQLQRGEDPQFDQVLNALCGVSEHCLPSVLRAAIAWYDQQNKQLYVVMQQKVHAAQLAVKSDPTRQSQKSLSDQLRPERDYLLEKRGLAVDFIFCLVLIEVLKQLPLHPGHDDLISHIIQLSFKQFRYKDVAQLGENANNVHNIADLFAEVLGVLTQSRFHIVKNKFLQELNDLRNKEGTPLASQNIIALLMGMKFFRVKMVPIEEFELCMSFLHELAVYFIEVKDREVKHALAGLFVEILLPVASIVKTEVNVPAVKNFVDLLYPHTLDYAAKKKHSLAFFPLLTCLLCISQRQFFLSNWHCFLHMCLSNLKHKDNKMSRVALESLYRLVWVYVLRIKCESNASTQSRLQSICSSLFPKGGRCVMPRDMPLNIFVKIIHFIAQERLDFAFKEVIFDLLCVGRPIRTIFPERMNIGLRALLVIADSLQQRDGPPPMPKTIGVLPSGNTMRVKRTYLTKPLTSEVARAIGIEVYYGPCRRAFDGILRALDLQVGRPLLTTTVHVSGKEAEDLLGGERKPKLDLFRTCIAAIPRILPETMSHQDVIDMLARLTVHVDEELRALAWQTLQNLIVECPEWREDVFHGLLQFIVKEIPDSCTQLLDNALKLILQLLCCWRNMLPISNVYCSNRRDSAASFITNSETANANRTTPAQVRVAPLLRPDGKALVLHCIEGLALVMLCQSRLSTRKLAVAVLKEAKQMLPMLCADEAHERPAIDVLDSACSYVLEKYIPHVSTAEKALWLPHFDFLAAAEKIPAIEGGQSALVNAEEGNEYMQWDAWACALSGFTEPQYLLQQCPTAVAYAWQALYSRMGAVFTYVDPNNPQNDTRASLLRSSKSKATSSIHGESLNYSNYLSLWQKYLVFACAVAPPPLTGASILVRSVSPLTLQASSEGGESRPAELRIPRVANVSASNLFRQVLPLLRCEMTDMRDIVVLGLGSINPASFECLLDELGSYLREGAERRQENLRRKKRRDYLRLQLIRLLEIAVFRRTISNANLIDSETRLLKPVILDFIESARLYLENDHDREQTLTQAMRLHFAKLVATLVSSFSVEKRSQLFPNDTRKNLFYLFTSWSGRLGLVLDRCRNLQNRDNLSSDEFFAVSAMCSMLTCGPIFDINAISDDKGYVLGWLDALIGSQNEKVIPLSEETLILLLEFNAEVPNLLDWVIDKCFTASAKVADKCFRSMVAVFSAREYPCDYVSMFNLTLMYAGYPVTEIQCLAIELLQMLDQRFFGDTSICYSTTSEENSRGTGADQEGSTKASETSQGNELLDVGFSKSQLALSEQLAELHPDMTMPIFSEISQRLQTAKPARRASMLRYLLPWMYNIELVDPNLESSDSTLTLSLAAKINEANALARRVLKGEGWGSPQATEMILNNLLYLTVKYGNEHASLVEALWAGLIVFWPNNLRVVTRYLQVMVTLSPEILLSYAKRIVIYMARVNPERLVDEMMNELQIIDVFRCPLERAEMAPFYRWVRRGDEGGSAPLESTRGVIHTRRHTPSEAEAPQAQTADTHFDDVLDPNIDPSASMASLVTLKPDGLNGNTATSPIAEETESIQQVVVRKRHADPFQLPMPAYGGYYCALSDYLPCSDSAVVVLHRSYLGVLLVTDLVIADVDIEWSIHLPLVLHVAVLGLDHSRALVHDSCKQILINLILAHSSTCVPSRDVTRVLVTHSLGSQLSLATRLSLETMSSNGDKFGSVSSRGSDAFSSVSNGSANALQARSRSYSQLLERDSIVNRFGSAAEIAICITEFLASKKGSAMWVFEDITARNWRITSCEQLTNFVSHLSRLFAALFPKARIETRWAQTALHVALCCSNRHYAGRSFQILRALRIALTSRMLSDILSRLVETVCEQGEDMQGYVTEIMLTLDSSVLHMEVAEHSLAGFVKDSIGFQSMCAVQQRAGLNNRQSPTHHRSTSCQVTPANMAGNGVGKRLPSAIVGDRRSGNLEWRSLDGVEEGAAANLPRSKSAHALKTIGEGQDEHMTALSQLLWIAVSLLESDYEHEFLLALRLLEKLIDLSPTERQDLIDRLDRMIRQINWTSFTGLIFMVAKGCNFANTYEATVQILTKLTPLLTLPAVDAAQQKGFPLTVIAMMPYLVLHYEDPTKLCVMAAENIAESCSVELERINAQQSQQQKSEQHPLEHLGTVMRLYSKRTFSKECMQWAKCVIKYLSDTYPAAVSQLLVVLTEMLDRGPVVSHLPVLQLIYCVFHHVDLSVASPLAINGECLKVVSRHVQGPHWTHAARIMKLAVTRSSSLSSPCNAGDGASADVDAQRKELPGRVLEFKVDMAALNALAVTPSPLQSDSSPKRQLTPADGSTLRKPWLNQLRVREHLVCLLNASGLRVGLPKSPSVIFSQSSHDIAGEPPSSVYSSSGELTIGNERASTPSLECNKTDVTSDTYAPVFKEFDFLEGEQDSMSESAESCFNWLSTMRPRSISSVDEDGMVASASSGNAPTPYQSEGQTEAHRSGSDSSDDDESSSSQVEEDSGETLLSAEIDNLFNTPEQDNQTDDRVPTPASVSVCGSVGTPAADYSLTNHWPLFNLECSHHATGQIDEAWSSLIAQVVSDVAGSATANTTLVFTQLCREACSRMCSLVRDACHFMAMSQPFRDIAVNFSDYLDILMRLAECPFLFVTPTLLSSENLLQRQKYFVLELREHYDLFLERRESTIRCLNGVKSSLKLQSMGQKLEEQSAVEQELELCRSLQKLFFQLLSMCETYSKMVHFLKTRLEQGQNKNLTDDAALLHRDLLRAVGELTAGGETQPLHDVAGSPQHRLQQFLHLRDYKQALMQLRSLRNHHSRNEMYGCCDEVDVEFLLLLFCQLMAESRSACFALIGSEVSLTDNCNRLMEANINISTAVRTLIDSVRKSNQNDDKVVDV